MAKKKKKSSSSGNSGKGKCSFCKEIVRENDDYVALLTVKNGKTVASSYYHFAKGRNCWLAFFNSCVEKKFNGVKDKLLGVVKNTLGEVNVGGILKGLLGLGKNGKQS